MNIDLYDVIFNVYIWQHIYEDSHMSYREHELEANKYDFMIYVPTEYSMNHRNGYLQEIFSTLVNMSLSTYLCLSWSFIRHSIWAEYERVYNLSIYRVYYGLIWKGYWLLSWCICSNKTAMLQCVDSLVADNIQF